MENFHKNQPISLNIIHFIFKTIKLMFTDINIYPINNKAGHISKKYILYIKKGKTKVDIWYFVGPVFYETYPRIRIHIKMKRIRNTGLKHCFTDIESICFPISSPCWVSFDFFTHSQANLNNTLTSTPGHGLKKSLRLVDDILYSYYLYIYQLILHAFIEFN